MSVGRILISSLRGFLFVQAVLTTKNRTSNNFNMEWWCHVVLKFRITWSGSIGSGTLSCSRGHLGNWKFRDFGGMADMLPPVYSSYCHLPSTDRQLARYVGIKFIYIQTTLLLQCSIFICSQFCGILTQFEPKFRWKPNEKSSDKMTGV